MLRPQIRHCGCFTRPDYPLPARLPPDCHMSRFVGACFVQCAREIHRTPSNCGTSSMLGSDPGFAPRVHGAAEAPSCAAYIFYIPPPPKNQVGFCLVCGSDLKSYKVRTFVMLQKGHCVNDSNSNANHEFNIMINIFHLLQSIWKEPAIYLYVAKAN